MKHFIKAINCLFILSTNSLSSQDVNPFTGSVNYGVPILSIPSDRGNAVPINLSYGGNGIGVLQPASEVGLGWGLSAGGSIIRVVNGVPDDFNGPMFDNITKTFINQRGVLSPNGPTNMEILSSKRNLDSTTFYYPSYDSYSVSGPGIGGTMTPLLLSYMSFSLSSPGQYSYDPSTSGTWKKPQFMFYGDFSDTLTSRHYPTSPVSINTPFRLPQDQFREYCYNDATPYFGKRGDGYGVNCNENFDQEKNRLATSNYVEYYQDPYTGTIAGFYITNSAGFVYHYGLPIYSYSSVNYSYPLNRDYSIPKYTSSYSQDTKNYTGNNYYVEHDFQNEKGTYITEVKETNTIPVEWKLTSITGPDYEDVGKNGIDDADKGYWVSFEYNLWSNSFNTRYPTYGFNYLYGIHDETTNLRFQNPKKRSGKFATANLSNEQIWYLNAIKTSTHKAIFVRDVRNDEVGAIPNYDASLNDSLKISSMGTVTAWHGKIFDEGGATSYTPCLTYPPTNYAKTIQFGNVSSLVLKFNELDLARHLVNGKWIYDELHVFAGPNDACPEISFTHNSQNYTSPFIAGLGLNANVPMNQEITINSPTYTCITFKIVKKCSGQSYAYANGFNVEWHAISNKKTPQLFVKRVLLFNNSATTNSVFSNINSITSANSDFDFSNTSASISPPFNETWYQANKSFLDANTLKGTLLEYDYSLANNYHKNINVKENRTTRISSPSHIQSNLSVNTVTVGTGKLTLNKIVPLELGGNQLYPSLKFDYNKSISTDNPDFNPMKADYWGYYKSDLSSLGYYRYTTSVSKDFTDAWMLRKITSPMGGITEIEYESNSYNRVIRGDGGHRGPSHIFPIEEINNAIYLEEGNNLTNDISDVYYPNGGSTISVDFFYPENVDEDYLNNSPDPASLYNHISGSIETYTYNSSAPLPLYPDFGLYDQYYTGNGWIRFTGAPGITTMYGNGSRVKKITNKNGTKDSYSILYEYENGVALNEAHKFTNPVYRHESMSRWGDSVADKLRPFGSDPYDLSPSIGYSKVKVKNLGQINESKGWTETTFCTSDFTNVNGVVSFIDNFKPNLSGKIVFPISAASTYTDIIWKDIITCTRLDTGTILEYVDKFSPYWGLTKEKAVYDVNGNMLSKDVFEYETTEQGAIVENFLFMIKEKPYTPPPPSWDPLNGTAVGHYSPCRVFEGTNKTYQTCIKRQFPAVLKSTTSYGMGTKSITKTLKRDEVTGEATVIQIIGDNNTSALAIKTPAFRVPQYLEMGPKSVNKDYKNLLGAQAYYYSVIDSSLTGTTGNPSINFAGANANVYSTNSLVRGYNSSSNTYTNSSVTLPYWFSKSSYNWSGDVGSIDTYGLYKKSELSLSPFNYANPSASNSKWRFGGEVSLLDEKGHTIETRGFNNKFGATKLDFYSKYVISQISNCNYKSFTFSGFELDNTTLGLGINDGEINMPSNTSIIIPSGVGGFVPHSGKYVAQVSNTGMGPNYSVAFEGIGSNGEELGLLRDRIYRASVWVHSTSGNTSRIVLNLNGSVGGVTINQTATMAYSDTKAVTVGSWKLLYVDIKVPATYSATGGTTNKLTAYLELPSGGVAYFDDFQLHPIESSVASKVYDTTNGRILADINSDGYATKYEYDSAGRVTAIYQEIPGVGLKLIKTNSYNYARGTN